MEKNQITEKLVKILAEEVADVNADDIDTSASLVDEIGVDSVSLIKMIVNAEKEFSVQFDDRELALNRYECLDDVVDTIEKKLQ